MGQYHRLLKYALYFGTIFSIAAFAVSRMLAKPLVNLFVSPEFGNLRVESVRIFSIVSYSFLLCGCNIILGGFFTAVEHPKASMSISLGRGVLFVAISLWILTAIFQGEGIWWAAVLSEGLCFVLTLILSLSYKRQIG